MKKVLVLHGVNLNMFGKCNPEQYGTITFDEINEQLKTLAEELALLKTIVSNPDWKMRKHQKAHNKLIKPSAMI